jgi:hypothetical protein
MPTVRLVASFRGVPLGPPAVNKREKIHRAMDPDEPWQPLAANHDRPIEKQLGRISDNVEIRRVQTGEL